MADLTGAGYLAVAKAALLPALLLGEQRACYQRRETGTRKRHQIEYFEDDKKVDRKQRKNEKWNEERCGSEEKGNAVFVKRSVRGASRCRGGHGEFS